MRTTAIAARRPRGAVGSTIAAVTRFRRSAPGGDEGQADRLKEVFDLLGSETKAKPCKGMGGLIEEGEEVIAEASDVPGAAVIRQP